MLHIVHAGFDERLKSELKPHHSIEIIGTADRQHSAWKGGSIVGEHSLMEGLMATKIDYEEVGTRVAHGKPYFRPNFDRSPSMFPD